MSEVADSLNDAVSNFKTAEAHFRNVEEVLHTLKGQLEDCLEHVIKVTDVEFPSLVLSEEITPDGKSDKDNSAEEALQSLKGKLEADLVRLAKISRKKSIRRNRPLSNEDLQPVRR
jgi:type I site-specific restriction endonuclease